MNCFKLAPIETTATDAASSGMDKIFENFSEQKILQRERGMLFFIIFFSISYTILIIIIILFSSF